MLNRNKKLRNIEVHLNSHVLLRAKPEFSLDDQDVAKLNNAYNTALKYINWAISEVESLIEALSDYCDKGIIPESFVQKHHNLFEKLQRHFQLPADLPVCILYLTRIVVALHKIWDGMYGENSYLIISNVSKNAIDECINKYGCVPDGYTHRNKDRIYLNLDVLLNSFERRLLTEVMIHECTHKFAHTDDYDLYYGCRTNIQVLDALMGLIHCCDGTRTMLDKTSSEKRINHAASMTNFICELAIFSKTFQKDNNIKTTFPERELMLKDTHRFFAAKKQKGVTACQLVTGATVVAATAMAAGYLL